MFKRIDHVELIPVDFERSIKFYSEIFGFDVWQQMEVDAAPLKEVCYLKLGDTMLELMRVADPVISDPKVWCTGYKMMALEVEEMDSTVEYLAGKGVPVSWGPIDLGTSIRAEINDPDGFSIELRQWK